MLNIKEVNEFLAKHTKFATACVKCKYKFNECDEEKCMYQTAIQVLHDHKSDLEAEELAAEYALIKAEELLFNYYSQYEAYIGETSDQIREKVHKAIFGG